MEKERPDRSAISRYKHFSFSSCFQCNQKRKRLARNKRRFEGHKHSSQFALDFNLCVFKCGQHPDGKFSNRDR